MPLRPVDLTEALAGFDDHWNPRVAAELNGQHVRLAKLLGEFTWHRHEREDELFLVLRGRLEMHVRDPEERVVPLEEGQLLVVPAGTEHKPVAPEECSVLLFEPAATLNTGNVRDARTIDTPERLA